MCSTSAAARAGGAAPAEPDDRDDGVGGAASGSRGGAISWIRLARPRASVVITPRSANQSNCSLES